MRATKWFVYLLVLCMMVLPILAGAEENIVTDGEGWYLWDESGMLTIEGRGAVGENGMVSSGKYEASSAGVEMLKAGGNAVDAAVATAFALGVTEPNSSGLGGGGFMTLRNAAGETVFIDFRERAPGAATPALWQLNEEGRVIGSQSVIGGKAVAIPGEVAGLWYAFETYGSGNVTWADVIAPSIKLAEEGFLVTPTLYNDMSGTYDAMMEYPEFGGIFLNEMDLNYQVGEVFKNPAMAKTLRMIAEGGKDAFYTGEIAEAMVSVINKYGGVYTMEDFANYEVKVHEPVKGTYRGYQIISAPLPSSGGTHIVQALNIMENFDIPSYGVSSAERLHILSEAFRIIFNDRTQYMGDPEYVDVPSKGLISKEYAKAQAEQISLEKRMEEYVSVDPWAHEHEETTHFSVADKEGNIVGVTQTVNGIFGAKIAPRGYGFVLNNEMDDFSPNPESPNAIAPGKTPLSSMSPTIVLTEAGDPYMVLGSPGATRIITTLIQVISNAVDYGMDAQEAIDTPRMYNNATSAMNYENRIPAETIEAIAALGTEVEEADAYTRSFGSVNAVQFKDGQFHGGADPRRDGKAVGY